MPQDVNTTISHIIFVNDGGHPGQLSGGKEIVDGNFIEEDRGYDNCKAPVYMFADVTNDDRRRNDVTSAWRGGDTVSFKLFKEDGTQSAYTVTQVPFVNQINAFYCTVEWREVLDADGVISECYTLETTSTVASVTQYKFNWGVYNVQPYEIGGKINPILFSESPVRILSEFNNMNDWLGLNFTGSKILDTCRLNAKFGYFNDNSEEDNIEYLDGHKETIKNEDFTNYELRLNLSGYCHIELLRLHLLAATNIWASDWNFDNYDYRIDDRPVIVQEGLQPEHFDGSRELKGVVKFEERINKRRTHFRNNRITSEELLPPQPCPIFENICNTFPTVTGQITSFGTGTDGDLELGRGTDWFTLSENNPYGNTTRFLNDVGGTVFTNILIDWAYSDSQNKLVLGWGIDSGINIDWDDARIAANADIIDGFSGWALPNVLMAMTLANQENTPARNFGYAPFSNGSNVRFWTGTTYDAVATYAVTIPNRWIETPAVLKTTSANMRYHPVRIFTYAELGL